MDTDILTALIAGAVGLLVGRRWRRRSDPDEAHASSNGARRAGPLAPPARAAAAMAKGAGAGAEAVARRAVGAASHLGRRTVALVPGPALRRSVAAPTASGGRPADPVLVGSGARFHAPGCARARGPLRQVARSEAADSGLGPCAICRP